MALFPCCDSSLCVDPASPVSNLTAEGSDGPTFIGLAFPIINPDNPVGGTTCQNCPPPSYFAEGCLSVCESSMSQQDADLCAARQAFSCSHTGPPTNPPNPPPILFSNNFQACNISCPDGSIFTYRVFPGTFLDTTQAGADAQAEAYACQQAALQQICLSDLPGGCVNEAYSTEITSSAHGHTPFTFAVISGSLPDGLSMSQVSTVAALLSGTPTTAGSSTFTVRLTDASGNFMERTYTIGILQVTNAPPGGSVGAAYSFTFSVTGGTSPYTFVIEDGAIPDGLTLASDGTISGVPTTMDSFDFSVAITDSEGAICVKDFTITISGCDCTTQWFPSNSACRLRITGYFDGLVSNCPTGTASGAAAWDGTLSRWDPPPVQLNGQYAASIVPPPTSMQGKVLWGVIVIFDGVFFHLTIFGDAGGIVTTAWSGTRAAPCPVGVYNFSLGCAGGPATLTLEGYTP